ncbi:MAG: DUF5011 domain-containing protein [Bacilli bacterium]|nr:DUF5011 domain-containing protein [Bacilli bacterium]
MKKILKAVLFFTVLLTVKNVYAFDVNNYRYRELCGQFEVAGFHDDGFIDTVDCFDDITSAQTFMKNNGADDLAILNKVGDEVKIVDANLALLDLSVNPEQLTYFYENSGLTSRKYTYMDTGSLYGDVDGGFLQAGYSMSEEKWTAKVRIANFTGWIPSEAYEIVPITWVKSSSYYTVTDEYIRHHYATKIQDDYRSSGSSIIGPKPEMLSPGTYYSFDGHYFYNSLRSLMVDYKKQNYNNSVNKNDSYYNYYMYLSNHTRTTYSSVNIDEYIRNNLGFVHDIYGDDINDGASRLYGSGTFFYYAQEKYGVNALMSLGLSRNETGNGRSYLSIIKNNGFGLNAVDSDPINGASWYPTFASSILGYASHWATYGFNHPRDWRYFGPQFGDKWVGMNVKYASAAYWSEAMAANYYFLDRAFGLQDYNYYQLGVTKYTTNAYSGPSEGSKWMYEYPEAEDTVVIVGEQTVNGEKWYKVVSDLNFDSNYNEIYEAGNYNWNAEVYVRASAIKLINKGKNGFISPNSVTQYQNKNYEYNLYTENGSFKPRVGYSTKQTNYYYDSSLTSPTGQTLAKDRYVIIYAQATLNGNPVAYLVTSNYFYQQKEWVSADSIIQSNTPYGYVTVKTDDNQYTWVNYNTEDASYSLIGGLHTMSYVPILGEVQVGNDLWYKVPVNLSGDDNAYGYTLSRFSDYIWIDKYTPVSENAFPVINAVNYAIYEGTTFDPLDGVSATDLEDGNLTNKIVIVKNEVNTSTTGTYEVVYEVVDSSNQKTTKTIKITVVVNRAPVINANDQVITIHESFDPLKNVTATDLEDGNLTSKIKVTDNTVNKDELGSYKVVYEVSDSLKKKTTKEIKVEVVGDREPVINASNKQIVLNGEFDPLEKVTATDPEDGDITDKITVTKNTVNTEVLGKYEVTYQVTDSSDNTITKTIQVEVVDYQIEEGEFSLEDLSWKDNKFEISGYLIVYNHDNIDKEYTLLLVDTKDENNVYTFDISSWKENTPYNLGTSNGNNYEDSWFKDTIDLSNIPNGDYELYMKATTDKYVTTQLVDNFFNQPITKRANDNKHGYNFKVLSDLVTQQIELQIRDQLITTKEAPTFRTMVNEFEELKFKDNKLYIQGFSYNYKGTYNNPENITRKVVLEEINNYHQNTFNVGSTTGPYELKTKDNEDKTYAWYEEELDLSELEKGTYIIYVYTKTSNAEDYGELTDMFKTASGKLELNNKTYTISVNKERQNRVEIKVE